MEIAFDEMAEKDIQYWKKSGNTAMQKKIQKLLLAIKEEPYLGIGKPEALKYSLAGKWSRRINKESRIIYSVMEDIIHIHSLKGHYD